MGEGGRVPAGDGLALRRVAGPGAVRVAHPGGVACEGGGLIEGSVISYNKTKLDQRQRILVSDGL